MRWLEAAVQKGRDHKASTDTLLPVATIIKNDEKQRREAEKKEEDGKSMLNLPVKIHLRI